MLEEPSHLNSDTSICIHVTNILQEILWELKHLNKSNFVDNFWRNLFLFLCPFLKTNIISKGSSCSCMKHCLISRMQHSDWIRWLWNLVFFKMINVWVCSCDGYIIHVHVSIMHAYTYICTYIYSMKIHVFIVKLGI